MSVSILFTETGELVARDNGRSETDTDYDRRSV